MIRVYMGINHIANVELKLTDKRSIAINLKDPQGKEVLRRLIPTADALVSNIRPAGLARLGFGYEDCRALNPRLVYACATGFGQDGV